MNINLLSQVVGCDSDLQSVEMALSILSENDKQFISYRYGDTPMSLGGVASAMGVTRQRVFQIENHAYKKIRKYLSEKGCVLSAQKKLRITKFTQSVIR